jgi:hypothetical protein
MKRSWLAGLLAMTLTAAAMAGGINIGTPVISGDVSGIAVRHADLSSEQLQALSRWLEQHRSGWEGMFWEASNEPTQLQVSLKHSDGTVTTVCVIARAGGGHYLRLTGPGKWAYQSFGGIFKSWAATRELSDQEFAVLQKILSQITEPPIGPAAPHVRVPVAKWEHDNDDGEPQQIHDDKVGSPSWRLTEGKVAQVG